MAKKRAKKKRSSKKTTKTQKIFIEQAATQEPKVDKVLIENFVALQRVLTNLAINLDNLTNRVSKLLDLFEISAKALAEKDFDVQEENTHLVEKLDNLIDQNKILARGMALMHERMPREQFPPPMPQQMPPMPQPPPQQFPPQMQPPQPMQQSFPQSYAYTKEFAPTQPQPNPPRLQKMRTQETTPLNPPEEETPEFESPIE